MKVVVFDLDGTLCKKNESILPSTVERLHILEERGNQIVICSGKTTQYLQGLFRQIGLKNPILIGEMGSTLNQGITYPPKVALTLYDDKKKIDALREFKKKYVNKYKDKIWLQPNEIQLSLVPRDKETFEAIKEDLKNDDTSLFDVYVYNTNMDILPKGSNKAAGLKKACEYYGFVFEDIYYFGDSINDYPIFALCNNSFGIDLKDPSKAKWNFKTIDEALDYLLDSIEKSK